MQDGILIITSSTLHLFIQYLDSTLRDGGKPEVVRTLKQEHNYNPIVMVGDGVTDMQVSITTRIMFTAKSLQRCTCITIVG